MSPKVPTSKEKLEIKKKNILSSSRNSINENSHEEVSIRASGEYKIESTSKPLISDRKNGIHNPLSCADIDVHKSWTTQ